MLNLVSDYFKNLSARVVSFIGNHSLYITQQVSFSTYKWFPNKLCITIRKKLSKMMLLYLFIIQDKDKYALDMTISI